MQISNKNWTIKSVEQAYQKTTPGVKKVQKPVAKPQVTAAGRLFKSAKSAVQKPQDILTLDEKRTLKKLFTDDPLFNFYGKSSVQQVRSGMLLDVRG